MSNSISIDALRQEFRKRYGPTTDVGGDEAASAGDE